MSAMDDLASEFEAKATQLRSSAARYMPSDRDFFMGQAHAYSRAAERIREAVAKGDSA